MRYLKIISPLLLILLLLPERSFCQQQKLLQPYHSFFSATQTGQYLTVSTLKTIRENPGWKLLRQLNDSVFIISAKTAPAHSLPANNYWKLSPTLLAKSGDLIFPQSLLVMADRKDALLNWAEWGKREIQPTANPDIFMVAIRELASFNELLQLEAVSFVGENHQTIREELQINNLDLSTNKINKMHSRYPSLNGAGMTISIKENNPDSTDIDFKGRYVGNPLAAPNPSSHAGIMATMASGGGNSWYRGKGVAWGANISSSSSANLLPDAASNYLQYGISVQNHSYGVGIENFYGADAAAYDASSLVNDQLLFVFSAGNSGLLQSSTGSYSAIAGYANLTGSFKQAKNIITVGAVDSFAQVPNLSSRGPAFDGRLKPELVAYGEDGSSGAAALVSGTAAVLQQAYKNVNAGATPSSALIKAAILNSCTDVGTPGIDFKSGYGNLDASKAVEAILQQHYFSGTVNNGGTTSFILSVPSGISKLKVMLVWNDVPAAANAFRALQNDLDLKVSSATGTWLPWVLNPSPSIDSLILLPVRKRDSLNNTEQVTIDAPAAGTYQLTVNSFTMTTAAQSFSIVYQIDTLQTFSWDFPAAQDNIFPAVTNLVRWTSNLPGNGTIEYSIDGTAWTPVATVPLTATNFRWPAPDTNALAMLRMRVGSSVYLSDSFSISAKPDLHIGFNCADSILLYWTKLKGISSYTLFNPGTKYLQPFFNVADTQVVLPKSLLSNGNIAVASVLGARTGVKSYTTDYHTQGVDCYFSNLIADLLNIDQGKLQLSLGTTYQVAKIVFEKKVGNAFITLSQTTAINSLQYNTVDPLLQKGLSLYRVALHLRDGSILYSNIVSILYLQGDELIVFPNPVQQKEFIHLRFAAIKNQVVRLADIRGRVVFRKKMTSTDFQFPADYAKGIYLLSVEDPLSKTVINQRIVIL
ncbi:MAG: C-terminal target protein [Ferruginibacter sp.]|nr:C-terminal target protein [Ferruginibacter sp.]